MSTVTHCSVPRMHLAKGEQADVGDSCFLNTLPGLAEQRGSCGEGVFSRGREREERERWIMMSAGDFSREEDIYCDSHRCEDQKNQNTEEPTDQERGVRLRKDGAE
ncbi:uncharacterized protein V6R79_014003 [Siganus canaliculatus]